jgi:hypothetical protein
MKPVYSPVGFQPFSDFHLACHHHFACRYGFQRLGKSGLPELRCIPQLVKYDSGR